MTLFNGLVPKSRGAVDAPMNNNNPRIMRPTMAYTLMLLNQNSISPNLRTFKRLNKIGGITKTEIQIAEFS